MVEAQQIVNMHAIAWHHAEFLNAYSMDNKHMLAPQTHGCIQSVDWTGGLD